MNIYSDDINFHATNRMTINNNMTLFNNMYLETTYGILDNTYSHNNLLQRGNNPYMSVCLGNSSDITTIYSQTEVYKNGSSTTYFATNTSASDKRLKEYVSDLTQFKNFFMNLSPISFKYHDGLYNIGDTKPLIKWGFYAQDLIKDFEDNGMKWGDYDLVIEEKTDISEKERKYLDNQDDCVLKVNYQNFTALNTYMIQEAYKEIEDLKNELDEMKKRSNK